jgi:hypothetical protein
VLVALVLRHQAGIEVQHVSNLSPLIILSSTAPALPPNAVPASQNRDKPRATARAKQTGKTPGDFAISLDTRAAPPSAALPLGLGVDWGQEAATAGNSQAETIFKELRHLCDEAARRGEQPPGCHQYRKPDPWSPEPKKFGFAGGLPFVRLGKRCVLGLGFFGCGVGKLPEPNGHVLDDMRDPDRPRSSVPDPNE